MVDKDNETKFIVKGELSELVSEMYLLEDNPTTKHLEKLKDDLTDSGMQVLRLLHYMDEAIVRDFLTALYQVRGLLSVLEIESIEKFNGTKTHQSPSQQVFRPRRTGFDNQPQKYS